MRIAIREMTYEPGLIQHRHAHGESTMTLILAGALEEHVGQNHEYARPLSVVIKPADTEHANRVSSAGARTLQIHLPNGVLADELGVLGHWRWEHGGPVTHQFLRVLHAFRMRQQQVEAEVLDLLGLLRPLQQRTRSAAPLWLQHLRHQIDDLLPAVPRVHQLAASADIHPVYLARQFRRFFGCSVTDYIARRRAQLAASSLGDPAAKLSCIAYRSGYADQSHFCRGFRAAAGLTPRAYRQLTTQV